MTTSTHLEPGDIHSCYTTYASALLLPFPFGLLTALIFVSIEIFNMHIHVHVCIRFFLSCCNYLSCFQHFLTNFLNFTYIQSKIQEPDLLEFFCPEYQREGPELSTPDLSTPSAPLVTASPMLAFDLYRHNRVWDSNSYLPSRHK